MLLLYSTLPKNLDYKGIETYQVTNKAELKNKMKQYYENHSGTDNVVVAIHDCEVDDNGLTLVDYVYKYVSYPFVELFIMSPIKDYSSMVELTNLNLVFKLNKKINDYVAYYKPKGIRIHTIDELGYFFYGLDVVVSNINK